jgi:hypothetical protein
MKSPHLSASLLAAAAFLSPSLFAQNWPQSPIPVPPRPSNIAPGKTAPKVTDIWVIFKTHCDLGYTKTAELVNTKYRVEMMDHALRLYDADQKKPADERFKWTIAGWPMARNILGPLQDPARKARIETALRDGAFAAARDIGIFAPDADLAWLARVYIALISESVHGQEEAGDPDKLATRVIDTLLHGFGPRA